VTHGEPSSGQPAQLSWKPYWLWFHVSCGGLSPESLPRVAGRVQDVSGRLFAEATTADPAHRRDRRHELTTIAADRLVGRVAHFARIVRFGAHDI
jgi:hypothetical protein